MKTALVIAVGIIAVIFLPRLTSSECDRWKADTEDVLTDLRATSVELIEIRRDVRPRTGFEVGVSQGTEDQAVEEYLARRDPEVLDQWNELQADEARLKQDFGELYARKPSPSEC